MQASRLKGMARIVVLSLCMTAANCALTTLSYAVGTGLFMDTAFTIAASFAGGVFAGVLTAIFSTVAFGIGAQSFWGVHLFGLCSIASALLTCFFARMDKDLSPLDRLLMLFLLSLALCVVISIMGGLIAVFIEIVLKTPMNFSPETWFKLGLLHQGIGLVPAEIFARFPVNIVDRPISVFAGYGAALLVKKLQAKLARKS